MRARKSADDADCDEAPTSLRPELDERGNLAGLKSLSPGIQPEANMQRDLRDGLSRRSLVRLTAALAGAGGAIALGARAYAQSKTSQKEAEYQSQPKSGQACATCANFSPPDGCKLVEGKVSSGGWCKLYAPK